MELDDSFIKDFSQFKDMDINGIVIQEDYGCTFHFCAGIVMTILDNGQSCCEKRTMTCDDEMIQFEGSKLTGVELLQCISAKSDQFGDEHDCCFLRIDTTKGSFRLCMHNEHNGYYGGFNPSITMEFRSIK